MKMRPPIAQRMREIHTFHAMDLFARAKAMESTGRSVIHLELGEPDFDTPEPILAAGIQALKQNRTHYTPALGLMELREAIAEYYLTRYGLNVRSERIIITPGASGALLLVLGLFVNPGSTMLMADPGYPANRHFVRLFEGIARPVPVDSASNFQLNMQHLREHWDDSCVGVMLASPSNPTGTLLDHNELLAMSDFICNQGAVMIVDEIYHGLVYESEVMSAATLSGHMGDHVVVINSFSKYFGMTGWRLGWIVAPDVYVAEIDKLAQNLFLAASTPAQYAALAAFRPETLEILEHRKDMLRQRRDFLLPELETLGFEMTAYPQGAFYIYARSANMADDSYALAHDILASAHVAMTPGLDFGSHAAAQHMRIAYTTSMENLQMAMERLYRYFRLTC